MKLNDSTLRSKLKTTLPGDKFQKRYLEEVKLKQGYWYWTRTSLNREIQRFKTLLLDTAKDIVTREYTGASRLAGASPEGLLSHRITDIQLYPTNTNLITACKVELFFNPDFVRSASLYPQGYPDGVDNIIRLLTNGWDYCDVQNQSPSQISNLYRSRMHGDWHLGSPKSRKIVKNVYAVSYNRGDPSLFNCINNYNSKKRANGDPVFASLNASYVNIRGMANGTPFGDRVNFLRNEYDQYMIEGIGTIRFGLNL